MSSQARVHCAILVRFRAEHGTGAVVTASFERILCSLDVIGGGADSLQEHLDYGTLALVSTSDGFLSSLRSLSGLFKVTTHSESRK